jgi:predicted nucleotide-binding protein
MFIGSSAEALPVAEAVHSLMEGKGVESTLWNNGAFGMNTSGLESLMRASERFDYACFILRRDDLARSRGRKLFTVRDNVILEIGLFLGALGRERVFIIFERGNKPDLPSDLNGINFLSYDGSRADGSLKSALVSACLEIQDAVRRPPRP